MISASMLKINRLESTLPFWQACCAVLFCLGFALTVYAQPPAAAENVIVIDGVQDSEIFAFGKTVVVRKEAKGVLVFGGDLIVEGKIEGEAATIGGSIYQKENAYIGGDVIVFGGKYQHERAEPLRAAGKETVMYAGYEEELRNLTQHPTEIFAPALSWSYFAQRLLSTLFWFIVSLIVTTIAPGAVSRAVAHLQLSALKIIGVGLLTFITVTLGVITGFSFLPSFLSGIVGLMASLLLILAYVYGRVALQVSFGKYLQKRFLPESYGSESIALLLGTVVWTLLTSLPYLGVFAALAVFAASLGLILTAHGAREWRKN